MSLRMNSWRPAIQRLMFSSWWCDRRGRLACTWAFQWLSVLSCLLAWEPEWEKKMSKHLLTLQSSMGNQVTYSVDHHRLDTSPSCETCVKNYSETGSHNWPTKRPAPFMIQVCNLSSLKQSSASLFSKESVGRKHEQLEDMVDLNLGVLKGVLIIILHYSAAF